MGSVTYSLLECPFCVLVQVPGGISEEQEEMEVETDCVKDGEVGADRKDKNGVGMDAVDGDEQSVRY